MRRSRTRPQRSLAWPEDRIATLAARQHGVVTRRQLLAAGLTAHAVDGRVRTGRLHPLHRGVYLLGALRGPLQPPRSREMAAVLACGPSSVLSHDTAVALWGGPPERRGAPAHVTIPGADRGQRPGVRPHRVRILPAGDVARLDGLPVTTPARTLLDLASASAPRVLERATADALQRGLVAPEELLALLERRPGTRGGPLLRRLLSREVPPALTRSEAEERFLHLVRRGGLPAPETNVRLDDVEVDVLWRSARLVVEIDGFAHHRGRRAFERDRLRDARLAARGFRTVRVTWRQLVDEPHALLVRIAQLLALAGVAA